MLRFVRLFTALTLMIISHQAIARDKLKIITSFSILADLVEQIGGDNIIVESLVPPNADMHLFEPNPSDIARLAAADLIIVNGLGFEPWFDRVASSLPQQVIRITASDGVKPLAFAHDDHGDGPHDGSDPHAWLDVNNVRSYVRVISAALATSDPDHRTDYDQNLARYDAALAALDADIRRAVAQIPPQRRKLVTTHDAFGYFSKAYDIEMRALLGIGREAQPSAKDLARIIRQIRAEAVPAIFLETMIDPRLARQIAIESGAKIGGTLYSDTLSAKNGPAGTYIAMMETNIKEITQALAP